MQPTTSLKTHDERRHILGNASARYYFDIDKTPIMHNKSHAKKKNNNNPYYKDDHNKDEKQDCNMCAIL